MGAECAGSCAGPKSSVKSSQAEQKSHKPKLRQLTSKEANKVLGISVTCVDKTE